jgi:predicted unusual protein kinase regulating ubiquinone biosynthesis (AarF/ABC1/UbiB family)
VSISLQPRHLKRYKDIAFLFAKYGHGELLRDSGLFDDTLPHQPAVPVPAKAEELAADLEQLGPTFVKLGQLLSTRADFLPPAYLQALTRLQDKVEPFAFSEVEAIIPVEIGARISKAFAHFESEPMAAASLGQVHRASLRDGRAVAVKVQRPGIREKMMEDIDALDEIAQFLDTHTDIGRRYEFSSIIEQFRKSLLAELDYREEAQNLKVLGEKLRDFRLLVVPQPIDDYTTSRVLTMEYVPGKKITDLSSLVRMELDGHALAEEIFKAYLQQILVDGFFHADPHPGNIFLTEDRRIGLIDLGMVGRIAPKMQENLLQLLLSISEGRSDDAASSAIKIGQPREDFDELQFRRRIGEVVINQKDATVEQMQVGRVVMDVTMIAAECGIRVPAELSLLGKTLLNLDLVGRSLASDFDPNSSIRRNAAEMLRSRLMKSLAPGNLFSGLLEIKDLVERLPERINRILDAIANNSLRVKVDTIDEKVFMSGLQKIANRITVGLVIASLIIGAALLMRIDTQFRIFGYPGFAMICFLLATGAGLFVVFSILAHDTDGKKK